MDLRYPIMIAIIVISNMFLNIIKFLALDSRSQGQDELLDKTKK
jgi:hypothetical protein